jgi:hypothetical protein
MNSPDAVMGGQEGVRKFVLPTKPLSIIDAINRRALATGGCRNAAHGSDADYNGHNVRVRWNEYRGYWVASYTWSDSHVIARGELAHCLEQTAQFYEGQGRGASAHVEVATPADEEACRANGFIPEAEEDREWHDWKFDELSVAMELERRGFGAYTTNLIAATSQEDYTSRCEAERRARLAPARAALSPSTEGRG